MTLRGHHEIIHVDVKGNVDGFVALQSVVV
jgi:hypothetical protein